MFFQSLDMIRMVYFWVEVSVIDVPFGALTGDPTPQGVTLPPITLQRLDYLPFHFVNTDVFKYHGPNR